MAFSRRTNGRQSQRGVALIFSLLVLLVITALAAGMLVMSNTETQVSSNFRDQQTAFFAARAGVEEIRDRLRSNATNSLNASLPTALPGSASGILYVTNPKGTETVAPWNTTGSNYPDNEICKEVTCTSGVPGTGTWYTSASASTSYAASPLLAWKWARITVKTNKSSAGTSRTSSVDGAINGSRVCWNGVNELTTTAADCQSNSPVYLITALGVTPSGSRRMIQYEVVKNINVPVTAAIYAKSSIDTGQALNITGNAEPFCSAYSTPGAVSDTATVTTPGGGNVTGAPTPTVNNYNHHLIAQNIINSASSLYPAPTNITTVPGVTGGTTTPPNYTFPSGSLGTVTTIPAPGPLSSSGITGTPQTYITPNLSNGSVIPANMGTLTLGGAGTGVTGNGVLLVQGNLTIDVTKGFNYFGLIVATGDIIFAAADGTAVNPQIHGAIIAGGAFKTCSTSSPGCTSSISNMSGSISLFQDACLVNNALGPGFYKTAALRELMY